MIVGGHIISGEGAGAKLIPTSPMAPPPPPPPGAATTADGNAAAPGAVATQQPASGAQQQQQQQQQTERKRVVRKVVKVPEKADRVLYCMQLKNPLRRVCINIVEWKYPFHNANY